VVSASRTIQLLAWSGCPSHTAAERELQGILSELGVGGVSIERSWIEDDATAQERRFVGSPTFRVNDEELIPPDPTDTYALTCRVYRLADGGFSPTPDPEQLRAAVAARFATAERASPATGRP
jgi:hypothetical protein